jgi:hypothetical protein
MRPLPRPGGYELLPGGRHRVTSDGAVRETRDSTIVWQLTTSDNDIPAPS